MSGKCNVQLGVWSSAITKSSQFIVKVQLSLASSGPPQILVYNEDQSVLMQGPPGDDILIVMRGRQKAFFIATLNNDLIEVGGEVPDPGW